MAYKSDIPRFAKDLERRADKALTISAITVRSSAKKNLKGTKGTGQLRKSLTYQLNHSGDEAYVQVGSPLEYATYQEFGTGEFAENGAGRKGGWVYKDGKGNYHFTYGSKPKKFLRRAFRDNKERVKNTIEKELGGL